MKKYKLKITEDEAITLFEYFARFDDSDNLAFEHPAEYLAIQRLSAQIEKTTSAMFKPEYKELLNESRNRISEGFEGYIPTIGVPISLFDKAFNQIVWPEFIEIKGNVYLKNEYSKSEGIPVDPIEAECFVNHIHILDHFNHSASLPEEPYRNESMHFLEN
jgi:hypothetical protein